MAIPRTYWDDNPEDRNYADDFWAWLQQQPQTVWLNVARGANWDQLDRIFVDMVQHPDCDRALASWLFWKSGPDYFIREGRAPRTDDLLSAILSRASSGGWPSTGLHYQRNEVALQVLTTAKALAESSCPPFAIPRELTASFEGENPDVGTFDSATEADLAELYCYFDGALVRDDRAFHQGERRSGNRWYEAGLQMPARPVVTADMSDVEAIEAVFGDWRSSLDRIEQVRQRLNGKPSAGSPVNKAAAPARTFASFVGANIVGVGALLAGLHFVGAWAAMLVLVLWIAWLIKRFV